MLSVLTNAFCPRPQRKSELRERKRTIRELDKKYRDLADMHARHARVGKGSASPTR